MLLVGPQLAAALVSVTTQRPLLSVFTSWTLAFRNSCEQLPKAPLLLSVIRGPASATRDLKLVTHKSP
jgi:hypothetical protein